jgi:hypothetical protein
MISVFDAPPIVIAYCVAWMVRWNGRALCGMPRAPLYTGPILCISSEGPLGLILLDTL